MYAEEHAEEERLLPAGLASAIMWVIGLVIAVGGFYALKATNQLFAMPYQDGVLTVYPPWFYWTFLPCCAALAIPWPLTLHVLRKLGYGAEAASIISAPAYYRGRDISGMDREGLMWWMSRIIVLPLGVATALALPMHMSINADTARVTRYAHLTPDPFPLKQAVHAYRVIEYVTLRDGSTRQADDVLFVFSDGRTLRANVMGDGGTSAPPT
jgi:hypothetical protein